jgi:hypothetical protein
MQSEWLARNTSSEDKKLQGGREGTESTITKSAIVSA